jgi:predicted N-acetyltransferase YhbS
MHFAGAGIGEDRVYAGIEQGVDEGFGAVHDFSTPILGIRDQKYTFLSTGFLAVATHRQGVGAKK